MNKIRIRKFAATLAAAVIIPALALAQGPAPQDQDGPGGGGGPRGQMGMHGWGEGGGRGMGQMGTMHRWGQDDGRGMGMRRGMHRRGGPGMGLAFLVNNPEMRKRIGITDEQAAKIRQQTLDFQKAEIRSRADLQVKRLELRSLLAAETPDRAAIDKALEEQGAARMALEKTTIDFHLGMRGALTPEQREKLKAMREEFRHRGAGPEHRMGGPGGPGGPHGMRKPGAQGAPQHPAPQPPAQQ
jgi:Spy/CpxP family protein refolding chaperone